MSATTGERGAAGADEDDEGADRERKGERTRRRLLELAIEQFGRKGFRSTSVTEITRGAGLTQAASYAYFENKVDLFRAAVNADVEALLDSVVPTLRETPVHQLLAATLVYLAAKLDEHPLAVRVLCGHEPDAMDQLRDLPALIEVRSVLAERLRVAQEAGEIRRDVQPDVLATGLQILLLALLTSLTIGRGAEASDAPGITPAPDVIAGVMAVFDAVLAPPA